MKELIIDQWNSSNGMLSNTVLIDSHLYNYQSISTDLYNYQSISTDQLLRSGLVYTAYTISFILRLVVPGLLLVICNHLWELSVTCTSDSTCDLPLPPGGYGFPFIGETLHMFLYGKNYFKRKRERYGNIYKTHLLGKPTIRVIGREYVKQILRGENTIVQTQWPISTCKLLGEGSIAHAVGKNHLVKKRAIMKAFTSDALSRYIPVIQEVTRKYVHRWCNTTRIMGYREFKTMYFDLSCRLLLGFQSSDTECKSLMEVFETFISNIFCLPIDIKGSGFRKALQAREVLLKKIDDVIRERDHHHNTEGADVLTSILHSRSSDKLTIDEVKNFCLELLFAGHGTTSSAACSLVYELAKHQNVLRKLKDELNIYMVNNTEVVDLDMQKLTRMTYLNNVVKEVLRLNPPVGGGYRKALKTFEINGYQVPNGWTLTYGIRDTHEMSHFFEDSIKFDPERWENVTLKDSLFTYLPFGGGRRACAGKELATTMLKVFALELIRGCEWSLENADTEFETFPVPYPKDGLPLVFKQVAQNTQ